MALSGQLKRIAGPAALAAAAADIYAPPAATIYTVIRQIRVTNKVAVSATFNLFVGATGGSAAGTEIAFTTPVAAGASVDIFFSPGLKMLSTDFLTGLASAVASLTITVMGEQVVV